MAFNFPHFIRWILLVVVSADDVETVLDACAADGGDCGLMMKQLRAAKRDVLIAKDEISFNSTVSTQGNETEFLSSSADSNISTSGCDWSGRDEFCKNWGACVCGKEVSVTDVGALVISCVAAPHLCVPVAVELLKDAAGTSIATNLVKQMLEEKKEVPLPDGTSAKARVLSGTGCRHCPCNPCPVVGTFCDDQPNKHQLCVAWSKNR